MVLCILRTLILMESDVQGNKIEQKIFQQICSFLIFNFIYLFIYFVFVFGIL